MARTEHWTVDATPEGKDQGLYHDEVQKLAALCRRKRAACVQYTDKIWITVKRGTCFIIQYSTILVILCTFARTQFSPRSSPWSSPGSTVQILKHPILHGCFTGSPLDLQGKYKTWTLDWTGLWTEIWTRPWLTTISNLTKPYINVIAHSART